MDLSNSPQFVTLYRGVMDRNDDAVVFSKRTGSMGQSWSTDRNVAEKFANFDEEGYETPGVVVTAQVHKRHILSSPSERSTIPGIHSTQSLEREQPVRKGGIVHVRGVEHIREDGSVNRWSGSDISSIFGKRRTGRA